MLKFLSTRGDDLRADAREAILTGLAPDGGLFAPDALPRLDARDILNMDYADIARTLLKKMLSGYDDSDIAECCREAYTARFESERVTPIKRVGGAWALELFYGETAAFKDLALALLPRLITRAKRSLGRRERTLILTATSGDTGSAAMNGFRDVEGTGIIAFYPLGGVSAIQRMQMTHMRGDNVLCCAMGGNFDDCQTAVKRAFQTLTPPENIRLSSANSINIGRLMPQIAYYYSAYAQMANAGDIQYGEDIDFIVPTGNFGDILAGVYAREMGLPIGALVCASNRNDVLTEFLTRGVYNRKREFHKTLSPSMDILISSNLERLIYMAEGGDAERVRGYMRALEDTGEYRVSERAHKYICSFMRAYSFNDEQTLNALARTYHERGYLADPHTSVGFAALDEYTKENPSRKCVVLATASPYKFAQSALTALGARVPDGAFEQIDALYDITRARVPESLTRIKTLAPRFSDAIARAQICEYILGKAESLCKR